MDPVASHYCEDDEDGDSIEEDIDSDSTDEEDDKMDEVDSSSEEEEEDGPTKHRYTKPEKAFLVKHYYEAGPTESQRKKIEMAQKAYTDKYERPAPSRRGITLWVEQFEKYGEFPVVKKQRRATVRTQENIEKVRKAVAACTDEILSIRKIARQLKISNETTRRIMIDDLKVPVKRKQFTGKRKYSVEYKLDIVRKLEENGGKISLTSEQTGISTRCIRHWRDEKEKLLQFGTEENKQLLQKTELEKKRKIHKRAMKRVALARRKLAEQNKMKKERKQGKYPDLEADLFEWFKEERRCGRIVKLPHINAQALYLHENKYKNQYKEFNAHHNWVWNFIKRNGLTAIHIDNNGPLFTLSDGDTFTNHERIYPELEAELAAWIKENTNAVTVLDVQKHAQLLYMSKYKDKYIDFIVTNAWTLKFIGRNSLALKPRISASDSNFQENCLNQKRETANKHYQSQLREIQSSTNNPIKQKRKLDDIRLFDSDED